MRRWWILGAVPWWAAACIDKAHYYGEEFALYYRPPAEEAVCTRVDSREILHWGTDPRKKKRIGYLYRYVTVPEGSREEREGYLIYDDVGRHALGFVSAEGVFYRFDEHGRLGRRVGEYPILPTGLKIFFGLPMEEHVDLEEVDPYR